MPTDAELLEMYDSTYFSAEGAWVCGYWEGSYVSNEQNLREEARDALPLIGRSGGRLLEIGPAGGFFLKDVIYFALREHTRLGARVRRGPPYHLQGFVRTSFERVVNQAGMHLTAFDARPFRPAWRLRGARETLANVIETLAYGADVLLRGGAFMTACAVKGR